MSAAATPLALRYASRISVRRPRVDVVGAFEHPALHADFLHQVVDGRNRLLVRRGAGVDDVLRRLLTLVLHRVEQQAVVLLEDRQDRLPRHRRPAAEDHRHLVLLEQLARLLGEERPVGRRIDDDRLELPAEQPALPVLLLDQHQDGVLQRRLADGHRARQRVEDANLDRALAPAPPTGPPAAATPTASSAQDQPHVFQFMVRSFDEN